MRRKVCFEQGLPAGQLGAEPNYDQVSTHEGSASSLPSITKSITKIFSSAPVKWSVSKGEKSEIKKIPLDMDKKDMKKKKPSPAYSRRDGCLV